MRTQAADNIVMIALHGLVTSRAEVDFFLRPLMWGFPLKGVRWVVPKAPVRPVTLLGGQPALAWYDLVNWDPLCKDSDGLDAAAAQVSQIVAAERASGVAASRIVLAGFSQGGQLALHAGLQLGDSIGGVVSLSGALPFPEQIPSAERHAPPVFMAHGLLDSVVPSSWGSDSARLLESKGYDVSWQAYPIGHTVSWQELGDVAAWLEARKQRQPVAHAAIAAAAVKSAGRSREYVAQSL